MGNLLKVQTSSEIDGTKKMTLDEENSNLHIEKNGENFVIENNQTDNKIRDGTINNIDDVNLSTSDQNGDISRNSEECDNKITNRIINSIDDVNSSFLEQNVDISSNSEESVNKITYGIINSTDDVNSSTSDQNSDISSTSEECESNNSIASQSDDDSQSEPPDYMVHLCPELLALQEIRESLIKMLKNNKLVVDHAHFDKIVDKIKSEDLEYSTKAYKLNFQTTYDCWFDNIIKLLKSENLNSIAVKFIEEVKRKKNSIIINNSHVYIQQGTNNNIISGDFDECKVIDSNDGKLVVVENPQHKNTKEPSKDDKCSDLPEYSAEETGSAEETDDEQRSISKRFDELFNGTDIGQIQKTKELILRPYQEELGNKALSINNCIICAPTNSGKTIVATHLIMIHLLEAPGRKVAFVVPKRILINQQATILSLYLGIWKIRKRAGSGSDIIPRQKPLDNLIQEGDVIIMTADILKNGLIKKTAKFSDFTLLVFDECHHCMDGHSYNEIMAMFLEEKINNPTGERPSIIGLTASPASKGKTEDAEIRSKIFLLCANLDAQALVTVIDNEESLKESTSDAHREYNSHEQRPINPFVKEIFKLMDKIENDCNFKSTIPRRLPQYLSQISEMMIKAATKEEDCEKVKRFEMLQAYHEALRCNEILLMENAYDYLLNIHEKLEKQAKKSPAEDMMLKLFKDKQSSLEEAIKLENKFQNPILQELKEYLKDQMEKNGNDIRGVIFVRTKENARALKKILKNDKMLSELKPDVILGGNTSSSKGMKTKEQQETLINFRRGKIKVIISTSVSEEGLDIPSCNLIVKYNYLTNEVASYQMFGRARAKNSTCISIGSTDCSNKEMINYEIQKKMGRIIKDISQLPREKFDEMVKINQRRAFVNRAMQKKIVEQKHSMNNSIDVNFKCRSCLDFICKATDIYQKNSNFVIDWKNIEKTVSLSSECNELYLTYNIHCKNCSHLLGSKYDDGSHCLGIKHFVVVINGENKIFRKWSARTFYIRKENI